MCAYYKMFFISVLFFYVKWWWWCQLVYTILSQIKWRVRFFSNNEKSLLIYLQLFLNYYKSSRTGGVIGWSSKIQWYYKKCGQLFIMIIFQKKKLFSNHQKKVFNIRHDIVGFSKCKRFLHHAQNFHILIQQIFFYTRSVALNFSSTCSADASDSSVAFVKKENHLLFYKYGTRYSGFLFTS